MGFMTIDQLRKGLFTNYVEPSTSLVPSSLKKLSITGGNKGYRYNIADKYQQDVHNS